MMTDPSAIPNEPQRRVLTTETNDLLRQIKSIATAAAVLSALALLAGVLIIFGVGVTDLGDPF